ncbi:MAG: endonuclease [Bacteroidota bacterium]
MQHTESFSQALTVSAQQLDFGIALENAPSTMQLTITNTLNRNVDVNGILFYNTYGAPAFSASEEHFTITALGTYNIWITFSPRHNIYHNSEMVIINDGLRGYVSVDLVGQGRYSNTYYNLSENNNEEALKTALHNLTGVGFVSLGYNIARDSMFMSIDNKKKNGQGAAQNTIECIYTGREAIGYTDRSDCQTNYSFNTEHTFPQTYFSAAEPMKSDLHHLFPTDDLANNARADNAYGIVTGATTWAVGGSKATNSLFEPRDAQKGAAARAMMYFVLRYQNYSNFLNSQENILRTWNQNFPCDSIEVERNNHIGLIQHNRNPFIDYPQFIERITSISTTSLAPVVRSIDLPQDTIIYGFVSQAIPATFHYVIVNNGNTAIQFSNFSLSQPDLSFQSGGTNTTLGAGEALAVDIKLITQNNNSIHASLNFSTDDPSHLSVAIPIYANDSVFDKIEEQLENLIDLYPNPVNDKLHISAGQNEINETVIFDAAGRELLSQMYQHGMNVEVNADNLLPGVYFIKITSRERNVFRKFVKE